MDLYIVWLKYKSKTQTGAKSHIYELRAREGRKRAKNLTYATLSQTSVICGWSGLVTYPLYLIGMCATNTNQTCIGILDRVEYRSNASYQYKLN